MRGQQERTEHLLSYISPEDRIPASHPLRQMRRVADQANDQGRLKARHKAAGAAMLVPVLSGLLSSLGPAFC